MGLLTTQQLDHFQRHRYLVFPQFIDGREMKKVSDWVDDVACWPEVPGRHMVYYEDNLLKREERVLSRIENFLPYHPELDELMRGKRSLEIVGELLGEPAVLFKEKINFKLPGGDGFKWHQDMAAGWDAYGSIHLTLMISIDASTVDNGCLQIAHGYEGNEVLGESWAPLSEEHLADYELRDCETQPGDAIFFDSFVPHGSLPNLTDSSRRILYNTYGLLSEGDHRVQYYADKRKNYPPDIERESGKEYVFKV
jgi:hypothetical protein